MGLITEIKNGQVVNQPKIEKEDKTNGAYDKDMFLKLLVAEMEYQDPLEPTSNTEYVSELASFTQIETVQGVGEQIDKMSASNLVGNYVIVKDTSTVGNTKEVAGMVDYVTDTDDGMMLSIEGKLYKLEDLVTVVNEDYYIGTTAADTIKSKIKELPKVEELDVTAADQIEELVTLFDSLTATQQGYVNKDDVKYLENAYKRIAEILEKNKQNVPTEEQTKTEGSTEEKTV